MQFLKESELLKLKKNRRNKTVYLWERYFSEDIGQLGVIVEPDDKTYYCIRFLRSSRETLITLGRYESMTVKEARQILLDHVQAHKSTPHPEGAYRIGTLQDLAAGYISSMKSQGKRTYKAVLKAIEKDVFSQIDSGKFARDVTSADIAIILSKIIARGAPVQSNRIRSYLLAAFNFGLKHDSDPLNLSGNIRFYLQANPVDNIPRQSQVEKPGDRFLTGLELAQLLKSCHSGAFSPYYANLILLLLYSGGQRPYEVMSSQWEDVDYYHRDWLLSKEITKNKRDHIIPITEPIRLLLKRQEYVSRGSFYLFPNNSNITLPGRPDGLSQAIRRYCIRNGIRPFAPRDLRRTCKTLMTRYRMGNKEIRDRLHNHSFSDVSSRHYNRYDFRHEKKKLLVRWGKKLDELAGSPLITVLKEGSV